MGMKFMLAGCLALAVLVSCGKKHGHPPGEVPPTLAKSDVTAAPAPKAAPVEVVSPVVVPQVPASMPEDIAPDEEDPSVPDTDQMAPAGSSPTPGQRLDRALGKVGKALQTAGEKAEKGVGVAADKTEQGLRKAGVKTGRALQRAGDAIEHSVPAGEPEPAPPGQ